MDKRIDHECGISADRLRTWLVDVLGCTQIDVDMPCTSSNGEGATRYRLGTCCIVLVEDVPRALGGSLTLPRNHLSFEGDKVQVDDIERQFVLAFVSSGG